MERIIEKSGMNTLVYCPRNCKHSEEHICMKAKIHLKYQEPEKYDMHGELVCKEYEELINEEG